MISISHAPNTDRAQRLLAAKLLLPWHWLRWKRGRATRQLEQAMAKRLACSHAYTFSSGREALWALLKASGIGPGDEVIIQAYTCIIVPHAVLWAGAKPVYVDIDDSLNMNPVLAEQAISPRTKALLVQHTFGQPANMAALHRLCRQHGILLLEDCAHALGASIGGREVGTWGDGAIFSFGRDKVISSVSGGLALAKDSKTGERLKQLQHQAPQRGRLWIAQNLLHPLLVPLFSRHSWCRKACSVALRFAQALGLLNKVYTKGELQSEQPSVPAYKMPQAMASLAMQQLTSLPRIAKHREMIAASYQAWAEKRCIPTQKASASDAKPAWLRFTIFTPKARAIALAARPQGFILGDWYSHVIMPKPADEQELGYQINQCPMAEAKAKGSLNLPTHQLIHAHDADRLMRWLAEQL